MCVCSVLCTCECVSAGVVCDDTFASRFGGHVETGESLSIFRARTCDSAQSTELEADRCSLRKAQNWVAETADWDRDSTRRRGG